MLKILLLLLFLFPTLAHAQMSCVTVYRKPEFSTVADAFMDLVRKKELLSQSHPRFKDQTGLCGFTCAINILFSMKHFHGGDSEGFRYIAIGDIKVMVKKLDVGLDGGVTLEALERILPLVANDIGGAEFYFNVKRSAVINETSLQPSDTGLLIAAAMWREPTGNTAGHGLVILKIDTRKKTLQLGDPNFPQTPYETPYTITSDGQFHIALPAGYSSRTATITELLSLESRRREYSN